MRGGNITFALAVEVVHGQHLRRDLFRGPYDNENVHLKLDRVHERYAPIEAGSSADDDWLVPLKVHVPHVPAGRRGAEYHIDTDNQFPQPIYPLQEKRTASARDAQKLILARPA